LCRQALASGVGSDRVNILLRTVQEIAAVALGERSGAVDRMRELLAAATALGDAALRSSCLQGLALAEANEGCLDAATGYGAAAVREAESVRTPQAFMGNSHVMYAWILEEQDRLGEALETAERLRRVVGLRSEAPTMAQIERWRARAHFAAGRWDDALVDLDSALTAYHTGTDIWPEPLALRALIAVHRGQLDGARDDLSRFDAALAAGGPCLVLDQPVLARAFLLQAEGQVVQAVEVLTAAWEIAEAALAMAKPAIGPQLARLAVETGDLATARRVCSALGALAATNPTVARLNAAALWAAGTTEADAGILRAPWLRMPPALAEGVVRGKSLSLNLSIC
jgi:tetratricopeptide (TPR) repeat protein